MSAARQKWHGTTGGYRYHRCRCEQCRSAWAAFKSADRRRRAGLIDPEDERHGSAGFYVNHGCRCRPCTDAASAQRLKARHAAQEAF